MRALWVPVRYPEFYLRRISYRRLSGYKNNWDKWNRLYTGYKKRDYIDLDKRQKKNSIIKTISSIIKSRYQKS